MIKINRCEKPSELTEELIKSLTEEYERTNNSVWNKDYIRTNLLNMSNGKCSYCEMKLIEEGKAMHVEHFYPKSLYKDKVVEWNNLLPSCAHCNTNKGDHDTYRYPIINPTIVDPKDFLYLEKYRYKAIDGNSLGKDTIDVLSLNDSTKMVMPRFKVGEKVNEVLDGIIEKLQLYKEKKITQRKNKLTSSLLGLMSEGLPSKEYSAVVATTILENENFKLIKSEMISLKLWNENFDQLEKNLEEIALVNKDFHYDEVIEYIELTSDKDGEGLGVFECSAGAGVYVDSDNPIDYAKGNFPKETEFLVKINGKSMEPLIPDGAYIPVKKKEIEDNRLAVLYYNGALMCKKYILQGNNIILKAINSSYEDIEIDMNDDSDTYQIFGEVVCKSHNKPYVFYARD